MQMTVPTSKLSNSHQRLTNRWGFAVSSEVKWLTRRSEISRKCLTNSRTPPHSNRFAATSTWRHYEDQLSAKINGFLSTEPRPRIFRGQLESLTVKVWTSVLPTSKYVIRIRSLSIFASNYIFPFTKLLYLYNNLFHLYLYTFSIVYPPNRLNNLK